MYHRVRRKMFWHYIFIAIAITHTRAFVQSYTSDKTGTQDDADLDNNIIDFDSAYDVKLDNKYDMWHEKSKESYRYSVHKLGHQMLLNETETVESKYIDKKENESNASTTESDSVPVELLSTTVNALYSLQDSTENLDLTVIPLSTTQPAIEVEISTVTFPPSSTSKETDTTEYLAIKANEAFENITNKNKETISRSDVFKLNEETSSVNGITTESIDETTENQDKFYSSPETDNITNAEMTTESVTEYLIPETTTDVKITQNKNKTLIDKNDSIKENKTQVILKPDFNDDKLNTTALEQKQNNTRVTNATETSSDQDENVPIFTELDMGSGEHIPEDYYDAKDVVPTKPPNTDVLSVIVGLAGSVVESMAERVVPKGLFDLFKRMQKQNEALEAEKLRSREENGGIGQFGRGLIKTISNGLSRPFSQLMAGAHDNGSLDSNSSFVGAAAASSVASVASSVVESFKSRVQAIYPGTLWCGDGHSAQARSGDLGLFFFTDTCCRQHDACKLYIRAGDTKHGLTNTGLFTRSHCSCDARFRACLQQTGSLVSAQIGLTYFNVLGPQCFRRAHPIVRCVRRTRITGQKCEEYELDYTKPKMWQWFDNQTF